MERLDQKGTPFDIREGRLPQNSLDMYWVSVIRSTEPSPGHWTMLVPNWSIRVIKQPNGHEWGSTKPEFLYAGDVGDILEGKTKAGCRVVRTSLLWPPGFQVLLSFRIWSGGRSGQAVACNKAYAKVETSCLCVNIDSLVLFQRGAFCSSCFVRDRSYIDQRPNWALGTRIHGGIHSIQTANSHSLLFKTQLTKQASKIVCYIMSVCLFNSFVR